MWMCAGVPLSSMALVDGADLAGVFISCDLVLCQLPSGSRGSEMPRSRRTEMDCLDGSWSVCLEGAVCVTAY